MKKWVKFNCVYKHIRKDINKIFYIGIGNKTRPYTDIGRNNYWHNIVNKVGYISEIILDNLCWEQAQQIEIMLIARYGRKDNGTGILVNMTDGGEGFNNGNHSEKTKRKIAIALKGNQYAKGYIRSEETKRKMSEARMGHITSDETKEKIRISNLNQKRSRETKRKISQSLKGHTRRVGILHTNETKKKISNTKTGTHMSEETRKKISIIRQNMSDETKRKMSESRMGYITPEATREKISESLKKYYKNKK